MTYMSIVSVRVDEKVKKVLEDAGVNISREVKRFLEDLAWNIEVKKRVERLNVILSDVYRLKKAFPRLR